MDKTKHTQEDAIIRKVIRSAKHQAPESLQYRIMQQIETEKSLTPQRSKKPISKRDDLPDFRGILGTMYLLLFFLSLSTIIVGGVEAMLSRQYILTALLIVTSLLAFWGLTRLETRLRKRKK